MTATCLLVALLLTGAQTQAPAQSAPPAAGATATIRGHVSGADTGQPLRKALVRVVQTEVLAGALEQNRINRTMTTGVDGAYEFKDLPAGGYAVSASKGAYVGAAWGQPPPPATGGGRPIDLHAGETVERVDFALQRGGVITGRILDEFGEPLTGLDIAAMRAQTIGGKRQLMRAGYSSTNDAGEFRLFGLAPGQYYVEAAWRRMGPGDPSSPDHTGYPVTFYPGTPNETEAQRMTVAAGQTISDLVMALSPIKVARVEGSVVDADGKPMGGASLEVMQSGPGGNGMMGISLRPDGTFVFASMAPGDYTFRAQARGAGGNVAILKVTVGSEDIKDLRLVALPPATLSGRIVIDPSMSLPASGFTIVAVSETQGMPGGIPPARVKDDLTFEVTAMPGHDRIAATNLPSGWAMRSVRVNSVDVIDDGFDVRSGDKITGIDVELTNRVATVSGLVTNARGDAAKDYTVVIFAADSKRWRPGSRYLRGARAGQDGRFKTSGLPPADYYIIAIDKVDAGQWTDAEFLERVRSKATSMTIMEGETKTMDLKLNTATP